MIFDSVAYDIPRSIPQLEEYYSSRPRIMVYLQREDPSVSFGLTLNSGCVVGVFPHWSPAHGFCASRLPLIITRVEQDSPAQHAGLYEGDHIVQIQGVSVLSITYPECVKLLRSAGLSEKLAFRFFFFFFLIIFFY